MTKFALINALFSGTSITIKMSHISLFFPRGIQSLALKSGSAARNSWNVSGYLEADMFVSVTVVTID